MSGMSNVEEQPSIEEMTAAEGHAPDAGHDAWVREIVERRLAKKNAGKATYRSVEDVAVEFGVDARSLL